MKWDELFKEFFPQKKSDGHRQEFTVTRPESLEARVQTEKVSGLMSGNKETHSLVLEFDDVDRVSVVKMLREAADGIEALTVNK